MTEQTYTRRYGDTDVPIFRPSLRRRLIVFPGLILIKLWALTLRIRIDPQELKKATSIKEPAIIIFWHNHILLAAIAKKKFKRPFRMSAITSTSRDGAWPAAVFQMLGTTIIRGSSHRRGIRAAREMLAVHKSGEDLCLTPDGSRGPIYHLRPGAVFLSKQAQSPLILVGATFHRAWRLNSWDRFYLPKPFSRIDIRFHHISKEKLQEGRTEVESCAFLQSEMNKITEDPLVPPPQM
ncbi:lysophospholipid acyltransferase family protein [Puniceicoccus vermicola]|uniref:Lysophospholipid acyltransferase family protein n=1 Tax=Puniceicoccus vermicola TaxID=388746 RepID=A0A7X1E650_9BACT|nr:lysophospholipid acyltransferase family protein [Puniceicoccus vermicola]MBC2604310.1 lysophospholipid acyltransferase family protein [Puniceicoccus vermicola]